MEYEELLTTPYASGGWGFNWFEFNAQETRKAMAGTYKLVVKDGDYGFNPKTGQYGEKDLVEEFTDLSLALRDFLEWTEINSYDDDQPVKATLTFTYKPKKGKKK